MTNCYGVQYKTFDGILRSVRLLHCAARPCFVSLSLRTPLALDLVGLPPGLRVEHAAVLVVHPCRIIHGLKGHPACPQP